MGAQLGRQLGHLDAEKAALAVVQPMEAMVAVVADPDSTLHGGAGVDGGAVEIFGPDLPATRGTVGQEANLARGRCTVAALENLRGLYVPDGLLFPVGPDEGQCFVEDGTSFVIVRALGAGIVLEPTAIEDISGLAAAADRDALRQGVRSLADFMRGRNSETLRAIDEALCQAGIGK